LFYLSADCLINIAIFAAKVNRIALLMGRIIKGESNLMDQELIGWMQKRAANGAVGPSTIRGMAPAGTATTIRDYLRSVNIESFRAKSEGKFVKKLDAITEGLLAILPADAKHWGMARKCVNIFLRNCLYNRYLCSYYKLECMEEWLEIPLDSHVGKGLIRYVQNSELPTWGKVISLSREHSDQYQQAALSLAKEKGVARIHLDDWLHRGEHVG
jgi:hypothetical protein